MDAYVFATSANGTAITNLTGQVGTNGVRVVLPLSGDFALYVAVEGDDEGDLEDAIENVEQTSGVSGVSSFVALVDALESSLPTHSAVSTYVGLAIMDVVSGTAVAAGEAAAEISGVIGVAVVDGSATLVVEATATTTTALDTALAAVDALNSLAEVYTGTGESANGVGFPS